LQPGLPHGGVSGGSFFPRLARAVQLVIKHHLSAALIPGKKIKIGNRVFVTCFQRGLNDKEKAVCFFGYPLVIVNQRNFFVNLPATEPEFVFDCLIAYSIPGKEEQKNA